MQNLVIGIVAMLVATFLGFKIVYYLPYVFSHVTEILAYISVGLIILGAGWFVTSFGETNEKR